VYTQLSDQSNEERLLRTLRFSGTRQDPCSTSRRNSDRARVDAERDLVQRQVVELFTPAIEKGTVGNSSSGYNLKHAVLLEMVKNSPEVTELLPAFLERWRGSVKACRQFDEASKGVFATEEKVRKARGEPPRRFQPEYDFL